MFDAIDFKWNEKEEQKWHVTIEAEKLKEVIKNHYSWNQYNIYGKIDVVTDLVHFKNDKELLEFLIYMED